MKNHLEQRVNRLKRRLMASGMEKIILTFVKTNASGQSIEGATGSAVRTIMDAYSMKAKIEASWYEDKDIERKLTEARIEWEAYQDKHGLR